MLLFNERLIKARCYDEVKKEVEEEEDKSRIRKEI